MPSSESEQFNLLDQLAEEFAERFRRGERPSLEEYTDRYPELADDIRELFPAMVKVEQVDEGKIDQENALKALGPTRSLQQIGDYRVLGVIGRGGMGVVYEAEQISLGRRVALKVLPRHVAADRLTLERFRREARAAARLHHTNIVPVFEVGQDGDIRFYAMQFIQGQSLDSVITELRHLRIQSQSKSSALEKAKSNPETREMSPSVAHSILTGGFLPEGDVRDKRAGVGEEATEAGPLSSFAPDSSSTPTPLTSAVLPGGTQLSVAEMSHRVFHRSVAHIGRQAAGALVHAHARGVIHRDIKPSNLLLDTDGVVWVTDFGLAKAEDDGLTQTGDVLGTIRYMAPERFLGQADPRSDVYALGLTLYELLVLRPAFDSPNRLALIEQVRSVDPPRPRSIDPRIPLDLETIVLKAVEKDPKARYASADAMSEDLRRFLADEPIQARQINTAERYWRWARRNPMVAVLGAAVTALLVAVTFGSIFAAAYFKESARRETNLAAREQLANQQSQRDRKEAIEQRDHSRRQSADLALDKGIALAREGHADRGLFWMLEALKAAPDDADDFRKMARWNLGAWLGQVHKTLRIIESGRQCNELAFGPDGRSFATGFTPVDRSRAEPIDLWDTASGRKLPAWPDAFSPFAFRADRKVLVAADAKQHVVAIDLVKNRVLWTSQQLPGGFWERVEFSPDARTILVTCSEGEQRVSLWRLDAFTGRQLGVPIRSRGWGAFAPDGRTVAIRRVESAKAYIDVLDLPSLKRSASCQAAQIDLHQLLFSSDSRSLFVSEPRGGILADRRYDGQVWDTVTGRPITPPMAMTTIANFPPSADFLVTLTENQCVVRDAGTGRVTGSGSPVGAEGRLASHPDGRTMLVADRDGELRLWQISSDAEPVTGGLNDTQASMTAIESNRLLRDLRLFRTGLWADRRIAISPAVGAGGRALIRLTDPATGYPMGRPASHYPGWTVRTVELSPDGRCFATGSHPYSPTGELRIWDASTGQLRFPPMPHTNYVKALAFEPAGKVLASGDFNGLVRLWDTSTGREIGRSLPQGDIVMCLAYSPDGTMLAAGLANDHSGKAGVKLWDTRTHQPIGELLPSSSRVTRIEFRRDGRALLADDEGPATRLWDVTRRQAITEPMADELAGAFRPDGRAFLTVGGDGTVKLRDAATGAFLASLLTASSRATCAAFRGDGGLVVAGFDDGTVRLCDPATKQPVGPPRSMKHSVHEVAFTSDDRSVVAVDASSESRTWPVPEPVQDDSLDDLTLRIEARTGLQMNSGVAISRLGAAAWRERLEQLGKLDPEALRFDDDPAWHEPMTRQAEQGGNTFAALWHLDRLIAVHPDDWFLYARRARAWASSGKFASATSDFQQAERLGSPAHLFDFQTQCVVECTDAERWPEALWYLNRLIAARPDDGALREERAAVYGKLGREADRQAELAAGFELGADQGLVIPRAEELGRGGRWAEAAGLLARCGRTGPLSRELAQAWGIACLKAGDRAGYREACAADLACQGPEPTVVWNALSAASVFALGAAGLDDYRVPISWFESQLSATPGLRPEIKHYFSNVLGGLLLRSGRIDEAIVRVNEGMTAPGEADGPGDWAYLALAHARKGELTQARQWLDRLRAVRLGPTTPFWDLQELELLRSEAESLLFDAEFPRDPFQVPTPR